MKRISKTILCLLMAVLIVIPSSLQSIFAASGHSCNSITWNICLDENTLPSYYDSDEGGYVLPTGNYYVGGNKTTVLTLEYSVYVLEGSTVNLCLGGHVVNENDNTIYNFGTLNLYDCDSNTAHYYNFNGYDSCWSLNEEATSGVLYSDVTLENIETISIVKVFGGALVSGCDAVYTDGTFNMYGGNIIGAECGIYINGNLKNAVVNLIGGAILGCDSSGVNNSRGTANMYEKFTIGYNSATNGAGVLLESNEPKIATLNMYGGTIKYNYANSNGGGVDCSDGTFNMYDGTVAYNSASLGGGVSNAGGFKCLNMYGGSIVNNKAVDFAGVYNTTGVIRLAGNAVIKDNYTNSGYAMNLCTGVPVEVVENDTYHGLTNGANICITIMEGGSPSYCTKFNEEEYLKYFFSDYPDYITFSKAEYSDETNYQLKYAVILSEYGITQQPTAENDYTVEVAPNNAQTTYLWNKLVTKPYEEVKADHAFINGMGVDNLDNSISSVFDESHAIAFATDYEMVEFDYYGTAKIMINPDYAAVFVVKDNHYVIASSTVVYIASTEGSFTISNVRIGGYEKLTDQTNKQLNTEGLLGYYCYCDIYYGENQSYLYTQDVLVEPNFDSSGSGSYIQKQTSDLDAHIENISLKDVKGTDENGNSVDYSNIVVYKDENNNGTCDDGERLTYNVDYTVSKGSIVVTLTKAYLDTLAVGEHVIDVDITTKTNLMFNVDIPVTIRKNVVGTDVNNSLLKLVGLCSLASAATYVTLKKKREE